MVGLICFALFLCAAFQLGGITPVLRAAFLRAVVPVAEVAMYPALSCAATLGSTLSFVLNATVADGNASGVDLSSQVISDLVMDQGILGAASSLSTLQQLAADSSVHAKSSALESLKVFGGQLWPPFKPAVKRYEVVLDDQLVVGCGDDGCSAGAPDIELEVSLLRESHLRVGREVAPSVNGTLRKKVPLDQLFRVAQTPRKHQGVLVQVRDPSGDAEQQSDHYIIKVLHPREKRMRASRRGGTETERRLGQRVALHDAVILQEQPSVVVQSSASTPAPAPSLADQEAAAEPLVARDDAAQATAQQHEGGTVSLVQSVDGNKASSDPIEVLDARAQVIMKVDAAPEHKVVLQPQSGYCTKAKGILEEGRGELKLWGADQDHILCFPLDRGEPLKLRASSLPRLENDKRGKFGFGEDVEVNIRPDIETQAVWPLESGVMSLPLDGDPVRMLGLRTSSSGAVIDMPLVVAVPRHKTWPLDVQFVDKSKGSCLPEPAGPGQRRFSCRATEPNVKVDLVVVCDICGEKAGHGGRALLIQEETADGEVVPVHRRLGEAAPSEEPWVGWTSSAPDQSGYVYWTIRFHGAKSGGESDDSDMVYEVAMVVGNTRMPWDASNIPPQVYEAFGKMLFYMGLVSIVVYGIVLAMQGYGLPAPALAALPTLSASALAMQFLAILGRTMDAPVRLEALSQPLLFIHMAKPALITLGAVIVMHGLAVGRHILRNGEGSAENLPHGLIFGGWELRVLGLVTLPLAYKAGSLALTTCIPRFSSAPGFYLVAFFETLFGCFCLLVLAGIPLLCIKRIRQWFFNEQVIGLIMPGGKEVIYVDRSCDQLRAVPMGVGSVAFFGRSNCFKSWTQSPGWMFSPSVSTIRELEHRGSPGQAGGHSVGSTRLVWEAGPWGKAGAVSKQEAHDDDLSRLPADGSGSRSISVKKPVSARSGSRTLSGDSGRANTGLVRANTDIGLWEAQAGDSAGRPRRGSRPGGAGSMEASEAEQEPTRITFTPVLYAHPIRVITQFVYIGGSKHSRVAGVAGLPWLDCAVPAQALEDLERELNHVELRVHAGQLSGALTTGRLGACFDWVDRLPMRFPLEMLAKIALGLYLAALPVTTAEARFHWAWMFLHAAVMIGLFVLGGFLLFSGPYHSIVDNLAISSTVLTLATGIFQFLVGHRFEALATYTAAAIIFFAALPIVLFFTASLVVLVLAVKCLNADLHTKVVPAVVKNWAIGEDAPEDKARGKKTSVAPGDARSSSAYSRMGTDDGADDTEEEGPQSQHEKLYPNIKVVGQGMLPLGELSSALPAKSKVLIAARSIRMPQGLLVPAEEQSSQRASLPVEAKHLFAQKSGGMLVKRPFGALVTNEKAMLLFEQQHFNEGGGKWSSVVKKTLGSDSAASEQAITLMEEVLEAEPGPEGHSSMVVVEILGDVPAPAPRRAGRV